MWRRTWRPGAWLLLAGWGIGAAAGAGELLLTCTADTSICCHPSEVTHNLGRARRIKAKGIENFLLLAFDTTPVRGQRVTAATLRLRAAIPNPMFRKVGVSSVSSPWAEGSREQQAPAVAGDSTFQYPAVGRRDWAGPGSDFTYVSFGVGNTYWHRVYLEPARDGWFEVAVEPRLVELMAQGFSFGLAVSDDNGEVMTMAKEACPNTNFDNNYFWSREAGADGPQLRVTLAAARDTVPPAAVTGLRLEPWPTAADFDTGALRLTWTAAGDDADRGRACGYRVATVVDGEPSQPLPAWRGPVPAWRVPLPPVAGAAVEMVLDGLPAGAAIVCEVVAVDGAGNASPPARVGGRVSPARVRPAALPLTVLQARPGGAPPESDGRLRVWAFGDGQKVNPLNGNLLEESGVAYTGPAAGRSRQANSVWDGAERRVTLAGGRGEWLAFQLVVEAAEAITRSLAEVEIRLGPFTGPDGDAGALALPELQVSRAWYIKAGDAWYADPLVPVTDRFDIPWRENGVAGQTNQTVYVEFRIPPDAAPGHYTGTLTVAAREVKPVSLGTALDVHPLRIPGEVHFVWSMNGYSSPGRTWGRPGTAAYLAAERDFYVQSHVHRTCLAVLHYSHRGMVGDEAAPPLMGRGADMCVADWSAFDARFGPLFDATAFAGTPRAAIPLDHFYLTFHENWPVPMAAGYRWNDASFEEHWRICGPVAEGFSADYQAGWRAVLADVARHVREKGWRGTRFQVYLNNKFNYKRFDPNTQKPGQGTSFWLLDEPAYADDYLALGFFGRLVREALGGRSEGIVFRGDISRPQFQRDSLDGLIDLNVCGNYGAYRRLVDQRRDRFGETVWTYGSLCKVEASALELEARALWLYGQEVDGFVPWLTLGGVEAWQQPTETAAFYPGTPVGRTGCVPSLRLKACRRGQQDVEYLWLLARQRGLDRRQAALLAADALALSAERRALDQHGAQFEQVANADYARLDALRRAVAAALGRY